MHTLSNTTVVLDTGILPLRRLLQYWYHVREAQLLGHVLSGYENTCVEKGIGVHNGSRLRMGSDTGVRGHFLLQTIPKPWGRASRRCPYQMHSVPARMVPEHSRQHCIKRPPIAPFSTHGSQNEAALGAEVGLGSYLQSGYLVSRPLLSRSFSANRTVQLNIMPLDSTLATSIIRIKFLGLYLDTTFDNVDAAMWSVCEISAGLTCACLPTLRPLAARYLPRYFGYQRAGVLMFNRHGKSIPPPLPLHQRPIWYGAESPKLTVDSGVALKSGKMAARSVTTDLDVPFDDYHKPPQYVYAAHSPKAAHPATTMPPQRPTLSRLISSSSSRRHSTPESAADRTEIIVIGLQCVRTGEGPPQERADGGDVVQQPGSVYRGWRNSEADSFSQQMHGPRETTWSTPSTATVPVVFWEDGRNLASPQYHHPEWPVCLQQQDRGFDHIHQNNVAAQFGNEFEGHAATTITRPGDLMMPATSDTPSTTQWYADAGRTEEANLEHIQGNNNRNRNSNRTSNSNNGLRSFWRWRRKNV